MHLTLISCLHENALTDVLSNAVFRSSIRVLLQRGLYNSAKLHPVDFICCKNSSRTAINSTLGQRVGKCIEFSGEMLGIKIFSTSVAPVFALCVGPFKSFWRTPWL